MVLPVHRRARRGRHEGDKKRPLCRPSARNLVEASRIKVDVLDRIRPSFFEHATRLGLAGWPRPRFSQDRAKRRIRWDRETQPEHPFFVHLLDLHSLTETKSVAAVNAVRSRPRRLERSIGITSRSQEMSDTFLLVEGLGWAACDAIHRPRHLAWRASSGQQAEVPTRL